MSVTTFRLESEMFAPIFDAVSDILPPNSSFSRVLREPAIGNVIPDLLIGHWNTEIQHLVLGATNVERHILAFLLSSGYPAKIRSIEERLYISPSTLRRALIQLGRSGAIVLDDSGVEVSIAPLLQPATSVTLVAVEMKLTRWREALHQAIRYLDFADEAIVILDGNQVEVTNDMRRAFELSASGLYLHRAGQLEKILDPCPIPTAPTADRLQAVYKLVSSGPYCVACPRQLS
jgi:hypothetical protein